MFSSRLAQSAAIFGKTTMPKTYYLPDHREIEVPEGSTLLQASLNAGIPVAHACGGTARCSTCRVMILEGLEHCSPPTPQEHALTERLRFAASMRLACQTRATGPLVLRRLILDCEDEKLASQSTALPDSLPGEEKHLAILFADLIGFTAFSEALLPYDAVHALNRYYHYVGPVVHGHGGIIDNYMGDGFMALFGMEKKGNPALDAVRAGLGILQTVGTLKPYFKSLYGRSFDVRIGVHCGDVIAGTIGFQENQRTTVIGDTVNFASRIEAANKQSGTRFLISDVTWRSVRNHVRTKKCAPVTIPGKRGEHELYEVLGEA